MPLTPTYPGVYIEELLSGVRTITGVATSITAFIGRARRGPVNEATRIHSFADYERIFGGLWIPSAMAYAVYQYFLNGGSDAVIVRVHNEAANAAISLPAAESELRLETKTPGSWGVNLLGRVDHDTRDPGDTMFFNLAVKDLATGVVERFRNVSVEVESLRFVATILEAESAMMRVEALPDPLARPDETDGEDFDDGIPASGGDDGAGLEDANVIGSRSDPKTGIYALDEADLINLVCIPPYVAGDVGGTVLAEALAYAKSRRAILLLDPPSGWRNRAIALNGMGDLGVPPDANAALYFPRFLAPDPLGEGRLREFAPSGAVAGVIARTDAERGVWKAPAGREATLNGVSELSVKLTDAENGELNPQGINCLRLFPGVGRVVWGSRTLRGADRLADQWKYLPVRRLALYLEESLYRGTQWVVFEPNDAPLWGQIRLNVGAFMQTLFRQGAFAGASAREAYFVKCDHETTTPDDVNRGIVNIVVGFAPLKPAEFVIVKIQQIAGQSEA